MKRIGSPDPSTHPVPHPGGDADRLPLLEVCSLSAGYGDIRAVWDVSLRVQAGRVTALLGPNGAGKSTTVLAIGGLARVFGGSVHCQGRDLRGLSPHRRAVDNGVSVVQEGKRIFRKLTVEQNLRVGLWPSRRAGRHEMSQALERAYDQFPLLGEHRHSRAGLLSGGQQQMLAIAQALICRPRILVLDEPSIGLAPVIVADVLKIIEDLRAQGLGILLVEQLVAAAVSVADDVVVLNGGRVAAAGTVEEVGGHEGIRQAYLESGGDTTTRPHEGTAGGLSRSAKDNRGNER